MKEMKEMKASELMLGDWMCYRISEDKVSMPMQVCLISESEVCLTFEGNEADPWIITEDELIPIPLTPEILEKNGFKIYEQDFTSNTVYQFGTLDYMEFERFNKYFDIGSKITYRHFGREITYIRPIMRIYFVHQLQSALRLCGIDKEIKLERAIYASRVDEAMREVEEKARAFTAAHPGESADEILAQMRGERWSEEGEL